jgi:hypothetical protein
LEESWTYLTFEAPQPELLAAGINPAVKVPDLRFGGKSQGRWPEVQMADSAHRFEAK